MGKKKKNNKNLKRLIKKNRVMLAALAGAATGIALAGVLGTEKAKEIVSTIESAVKEFGGNDKKSKASRNSYRTAAAPDAQRERVAEQAE